MRHLSFEQAYAQLQQIVMKMEEGATTLDDALNLYEQGVALSQHCETLLEKAELRVNQLRDGQEDHFEEIPFDF